MKIAALSAKGESHNITAAPVDGYSGAGIGGSHAGDRVGKAYGSFDCITINGAEVADLETGEVIYRAEIPNALALAVYEAMDRENVLYDVYQHNAAFMSASHKERIDDMVGYGSESIWVSTFHSTCVRILRRFIDRLGYDTGFTIYDTEKLRIQ